MVEQCRILLLSSDPVFTSDIKKFSCDSGWGLHVTTNMFEFKDVSIKKEYDIVLNDIDSVGRGQFGFSATVREIADNVPIITIVTYSRTGFRRLNDGAKEYIYVGKKDFNKNSFVKNISHFLIRERRTFARMVLESFSMKGDHGYRNTVDRCISTG